MRRLAAPLLLLALTLFSCAPGSDGPDTVTFARLDPGSLAPLRDPFNAAAESVRVLVMLSPT